MTAVRKGNMRPTSKSLISPLDDFSSICCDNILSKNEKLEKLKWSVFEPFPSCNRSKVPHAQMTLKNLVWGRKEGSGAKTGSCHFHGPRPGTRNDWQCPINRNGNTIIGDMTTALWLYQLITHMMSVPRKGGPRNPNVLSSFNWKWKWNSNV